MYGSFGYDVGVESVTEVDGVDVVAVAPETISAKIEPGYSLTHL